MPLATSRNLLKISEYELWENKSMACELCVCVCVGVERGMSLVAWDS